MICLRIAAAALACASGAFAASTIDPAHKFAWGENIGWTNWRDANGGVSGVEVHDNFLRGFIWGENVGWINVGQGPANCGMYANTSGADFGVNILPSGELTGFAWGENIGWINFDTRASLSGFGQQARFIASAGRFRGYVWGENVGWINLEDPTHFVGSSIPCGLDINGDDLIGFADLNIVISAFNTSGPCLVGDVNGDGAVNFSDLNLIISSFNEACP